MHEVVSFDLLPLRNLMILPQPFKPAEHLKRSGILFTAKAGWLVETVAIGRFRAVKSRSTANLEAIKWRRATTWFWVSRTQEWGEGTRFGLLEVLLRCPKQLLKTSSRRHTGRTMFSPISVVAMFFFFRPFLRQSQYRSEFARKP